MSLSPIGVATAPVSGSPTSSTLDITAIVPAVGDELLIVVSVDNNGGSTDVTVNGVATTSTAFTGYLWTLGGDNDTYNTYLISIKLLPGFSLTYVIGGTPSAASGWEVYAIVYRNTVTAGAISVDFATASNNASNAIVNITNPGGTTTQPNDALIFISQGNNPSTNQGPAGYTNEVYEFATNLAGGGVNCISVSTQVAAGPTGTITADTGGSLSNWNCIVVALKPVANAAPPGDIFFWSNF
jgi:hypothetical protein